MYWHYTSIRKSRFETIKNFLALWKWFRILFSCRWLPKVIRPLLQKNRQNLTINIQKVKAEGGHRKKNPKSELILSESNSPKKTHSNKNGYVNGTTGKGTESHRHYRNIANGINQNNNHHTARNGCLLSNGYATGKSKEQSQPENQHIKVSSLQCQVKSVVFKVGVCTNYRNHQTSLGSPNLLGLYQVYLAMRENGAQARTYDTGLKSHW